MQLRYLLHLLPAFLMLGLFFSCQTDTGTADEEFVVNVIFRDEPDRINPMLSKSSLATQVESHILLPLMEYDPADLQLKPVLVKSEPEVTPFKEGNAFTFEIRENAVWSDGQPVTGKDYEFTVKAALNPHSQSNAWRGFLSQIDSIAVDEQNPKRFTVFIDESYLLALPVAANFNIYPKHHYDKGGLLDKYQISSFRSDSIGDDAAEFGEQFNTTTYSRDSVLGCGPYKLTSWTAGQSIVLTKVKDWWGGNLLPANPDVINYLIVPDESTGITMLKSGQADIISGLSPNVFADLKASTDSSKLAFHTPQILQYYYLGLNNQDQILSSREVRQALSHLLDLEQLSEVLMANLAQPVASPIHHSKSYYNDDLEPVPYDPKRARTLLDQAGWKDSDDDGIRDKMIDGQKVDLKLSILVTQKELGRNIARILKENAGQVGVEIEIESQEWATTLQDVSNRDFHIVAMATRQYPGQDDLYQSWHTSSIGPDGRNITGFGNEKSDSIIERLRTTEDEAERKNLYLSIQEVIYEERPMIFLFAPTETIVHSKDISIQVSSKRPGYFEATAQRQ